MTQTRTGQFEAIWPDGMRVERLPVGFAANRSWVRFVFTGGDFLSGTLQGRDNFFCRAHEQLLRLEVSVGQITSHPNGGGGDEHVYSLDYELDPRHHWLRVTYLDAGTPLATETIDLA